MSIVCFDLQACLSVLWYTCTLTIDVARIREPHASNIGPMGVRPLDACSLALVVVQWDLTSGDKYLLSIRDTLIGANLAKVRSLCRSQDQEEMTRLHVAGP
jgi:hypothetical protein